MRFVSPVRGYRLGPMQAQDEARKMARPTFPRLSVHEYSAILQGYALAHTAKVKRAFVQRFAAELNHDERE